MEEWSPELQRLIQFFETISQHTVEGLDQFYDAEAYFKDPFNEVRGVAAIQRIFRTMFEQVEDPRFKVNEAMQGIGRQDSSKISNDAFLIWEFTFGFKRFKRGQIQRVRGSSHIRFDQTGKIVFHRDYWDAAEELYEKIPVLGALFRFLRRQAQH
jgi:steroid Delta-isomerase